MSRLVLVIACVLSLAVPGRSRGDDSPTKWRVFWVPWHDTYSSWDWADVDAPAFIQWANLENFKGVKSWEFAVCSATDATKTAREPLAPCVENNTWQLDRWVPGKFPVDRLATLGDGTFLCAILADGRRVSNISRVRIDRAGETNLQPGIRITPVVLFDNDIRYLAVRVIPETGQHIHIYDLFYPFLCVNGVWTHSKLMAFSGQNRELKPMSVNGMVTGFEEFDPLIQPFKEAKVQAKFTKDSLRNGLETFVGSSNPGDMAKRMKSYAEHADGYLSSEFTLSYSNAEDTTFITAFPLK